MSFVDKIINAKVSSNAYFKSKLPLILERAHKATESIKVKAKQRGMILESDQIKELHAKSMLETVNRLIFQDVYTELKQSDQSFSQ